MPFTIGYITILLHLPLMQLIGLSHNLLHVLVAHLAHKVGLLLPEMAKQWDQSVQDRVHVVHDR